jgi:hypothetical protein
MTKMKNADFPDYNNPENDNDVEGQSTIVRKLFRVHAMLFEVEMERKVLDESEEAGSERRRADIKETETMQASMETSFSEKELEDVLMKCKLNDVRAQLNFIRAVYNVLLNRRENQLKIIDPKD